MRGHCRSLFETVPKDARLPLVVLGVRQLPHFLRLSDGRRVFARTRPDGAGGRSLGARVRCEWHRTVLMTAPIGLFKHSRQRRVERRGFAVTVTAEEAFERGSNQQHTHNGLNR